MISPLDRRYKVVPNVTDGDRGHVDELMDEGIGSTDTDPLADHLPVKRPLGALIDDISSVRRGGTIYIFCGEAHPRIYNDERFLNAARDVCARQQAKIVAITGPILLKPAAGDSLNGLLCLHHDGIVSELYQRRVRYAANHFRVVETTGIPRYYSEFSHAPLQAMAERHCQNHFHLDDVEIRRRASSALHLFEAWKTQAVRYEGPGSALPLLATEPDLKTLLKKAKKAGKVFDYLGADELIALQPKGRVLLSTYFGHASRAVAGSMG